MLTADILKANEATAGLTDEQMSAIVEMSSNDEKTAISAQLGETHRMYDQDILEATGIQKNANEKSYDYLKRASAQVKADFEGQIQSLNNEISTLRKRTTEGADAELAKQLKQAQAELAETKQQFVELQGKFGEAESNYNAKLFQYRVDNDIEQAMNGIKLKNDIPQELVSLAVKNAKDLVRGKKADYIDNGQGGQTLVFRTESGALLNNPQNQLKPYTATELISEALKSYGVLAEDRQQGGAGSAKPNITPQGGGIVIDLSTCRTQGDAMQAITNTLLAQGLKRNTAEWQSALDDAWRTNNVSQLPRQ